MREAIGERDFRLAAARSGSTRALRAGTHLGSGRVESGEISSQKLVSKATEIIFKLFSKYIEYFFVTVV